ncbi:homocysteine S-methyltransferase [Agarivorans sp. Toyoura001]|uniref:homocysteine S-methyltransferase family protein n=1 Tax=Agarivorans sp. Toyoura001 TaxID=2283141 RepID=UPI0010EA5F25|nr:homocysteine S-methyltransferase family protein [Agarivorans sp. Toyoura001]GDY27856.1 homocysteine S-methyltransferase [Agarivorans sp. Toyoura001]
MAAARTLPQLGKKIFACYTGMETDLVYKHGIDLPGFAAYPLLRQPDSKNLLRQYYYQLVELAREQNVGLILDSVTWAANRDRGQALGFNQQQLQAFNLEAVALMAEVRAANVDLDIVLAGQIGPQDDSYSPKYLMATVEAREYHLEQIKTYAATDVDFISAFTICYAEEAAGIVKAAQQFSLPVAIAFTLETDGCLPTGMPLSEAIALVDAETNNGPAYYLINCAHPEHFSHIFDGKSWVKRIRGVVANSSRCSHEELEQACALDEGNPEELASQLAALRAKYNHFNVLGSCCGSDMRHMKSILAKAKLIL